jgi:hypothetical protein
VQPGGLALPDRVQHRQVIGVGQGVVPGLQRGCLGAVAADGVREYSDRCTRLWLRAVGPGWRWPSGQGGAFPLGTIMAL